MSVLNGVREYFLLNIWTQCASNITGNVNLDHRRIQMFYELHAVGK